LYQPLCMHALILKFGNNPWSPILFTCYIMLIADFKSIFHLNFIFQENVPCEESIYIAPDLLYLNLYFWILELRPLISFWSYVFTGFGCDTSAVINILAHRDATQRAYIQQEYRSMYSEELSKRLASELSGKLEVQNC